MGHSQNEEVQLVTKSGAGKLSTPVHVKHRFDFDQTQQRTLGAACIHDVRLCYMYSHPFMKRELHM